MTTSDESVPVSMDESLTKGSLDKDLYFRSLISAKLEEDEHTISEKLISLIQGLFLTLLGITIFRMIIGDISLQLFEIELVFFLSMLFFLRIKAVLIQALFNRLPIFPGPLFTNALWVRTTAILIEKGSTLSEALDWISLDARVKRHRTLLRELASSVRGGKICFPDKSNKEIPEEIRQAFEDGISTGVLSTCLNRCVDNLIITTTDRLQRYVSYSYRVGVVYIAVMGLATIIRSA